MGSPEDIADAVGGLQKYTPVGRDVFICYRRADGAAAAAWLRDWLRGYRLPRDFANEAAGIVRPADEKPLSVFLDRDVEGTSPDYWTANVRPALDASRKILVLWTPESAVRRPDGQWDPMWEEIEHVVRTGREDHIILVPIGVDPDGPSPSELTKRFPRMERRSPLVGLRRSWFGWRIDRDELTKIASSVCDVPSSLQPILLGIDRRRQIRSLRIRLAIAMALLTIVAALFAASVVFYMRSERERKVGVVRELSAQAQILVEHGQNQVDLAVLLAGEAVKRAVRLGVVSAESSGPLRSALEILAPVIARASVRPWASVAFAPDGRLFAQVPDGRACMLGERDLGIGPCLPATGSLNNVQIGANGRRLAAAFGRHVVVAALPELKISREFNLDWDQPQLSFSADGELLAATGGDHAVLIDLRTPAEPNIVPARGSIQELALDPLGRFLVTSSGSTVEVWTITRSRTAGVAMRREKTLQHDISIAGLDLSSDGRWLAVRTGKTVVVWKTVDWSRGDTVRHVDTVTAVSFSLSNSRLASGDATGSVIIVKLGEDGSMRMFQHGGSIRTLQFDKAGSRLLSGGEDNTARVWDLATGREQTRVVHDTWVAYARFSPTGDVIATADINGVLKLSRPRPNHAGRVALTGNVRQMSFVGDRDILMASEVGIFVAPANEELLGTRTAFVRSGLIAGTGFVRLAENRFALSTVDDGPRFVVQIWDSKTHSIVDRLETSGPALLASDPAGRILAMATRQISVNNKLLGRNGIRVVRLEDRAILLDSAHPGTITSVAVSPDGSRAAVTSSQTAESAFGALPGKSVATIWDLNTGNVVTAVRNLRPSGGVVFTRAPSLAIVGTSDRGLQPVDAMTGRELPPVLGDSRITNMVVSPDNRYLITVTETNVVHVWTLPTLVHRSAVRVDGSVTALACHSEERLLAAGTASGTIDIFSLETGRLLGQYQTLGPISALAFSEDARLLAMASQDPSQAPASVATLVETQRWTAQDLLKEACCRLSRRMLSADEAEHYLRELPRDLCEELSGNR